MRAPQGEAAIFKAPVRTNRSPSLYLVLSEFKSLRGSNLHGGEPFFAVQEAAAAAQGAQRAVEIESCGD
jgi:hypothetical protein